MEPTTYIVTARHANVHHKKMSEESAVVDVLDHGAPARIVDIADGWAETSEGEYILIDFLEPLGENHDQEQQ